MINNSSNLVEGKDETFTMEYLRGKPKPTTIRNVKGKFRVIVFGYRAKNDNSELGFYPPDMEF